MAHILPLLMEMRGRLGMYLGTTSITKLAAFLRGYDYAIEKQGLGKGDPLLEEFRDWVHRRFQTTAYSWEETILRQSKNEEDAVERFWGLLTEFLEQRQQTEPGEASEISNHVRLS
jgi:hypothetical protein